MRTILENAILQEYVPFIVLLFSLYTISGGIRIEGDLQADPLTNAAFMAVGAVLASFIGTTGAAMLLIRPLLETNRERKHVAHTVVFFIFIVCNCGGCLLPLGDPPLFLGYLEGVPFPVDARRCGRSGCSSTACCWSSYVLLDRIFFYRRETIADIERDIEQVGRLKFGGWQAERAAAGGRGARGGAARIRASRFPAPTGIRGCTCARWCSWGWWRSRCGSATRRSARRTSSTTARSSKWPCCSSASSSACSRRCRFSASAAASWASTRRRSSSGRPARLSSVLDNAPTYLVFFKTAQAMPHAGGRRPRWRASRQSILAAISLGAVFMGAMTYIGNGPNFMVKAIAETSGVKMPSFFGYMVYSFAILLPILALNVWLFLM